MDRLTNEERILAWKASWHPSFAGIAIVNKDFTFRSVNPQFCKLLEVSPAELIGQRFQDITPPGIKELDEKNSQLLIDGLVDFYLLPKKYQFSDGREREVVLLVTRAPAADEGAFQFFVSRILLDECGELVRIHNHTSSTSLTASPKLMTMVADFVMKYGKTLIATGTVLGAMLAAMWTMVFGK